MIAAASPLPWIAGIGVKPSVQASTIENVASKSAAIASGGSAASRSLTWAATTVTVHDSLPPKSTSGSRVKAVGPPVTTAVCAPLEVHAIANQAPLTATGSEKVIVTSVVGSTLDAPEAGEMAATDGATSPASGSGAPAAKSAALLSVSVVPPPARIAAVVLLRVGAAAAPSKKLALP